MTVLRTFSNLGDLPEDTVRLFEKAERDCFFYGLPWFRTFSSFALNSEDRLRIYDLVAAHSDSTPHAVLPLVHRAADSGVWKLRKLESLSNYYTSLYGPIVDGNLSREAAESFAHSIASDSPRWDAIDLKPLDVDGPAFQILVEAFQHAGFVVQTYFGFGNWYLQVQGRSYEQYLDALPPVLKNTLRRKKKKFEKLAGAKVEIITGGPGLAAGIDAYNKVYLASWKKPEPFPQFVPGLIRMCAEKGTLRLGLVYIDGQPAAAQLWIVQNGRALIYKLAYDERFADLSVGTILTATLMQHVIDIDKVSEVDYLTGDDSYKKDWMSARRERWGILAMNAHTLRGALAIIRHVGGRSIKKFLQKFTKRVPGSPCIPGPSTSLASSPR